MNGDQAGRVCTTIGCGFPATVRGIFDDGARVMRSEFTVTAWLVDPPIPDAPSPGTEQVREEIAQWLMREYEQEYTVTEPVSAWYPQADRLLALPAMRRLLNAEAAVQRVRAVADEVWGAGVVMGSVVASDLRRALDGAAVALSAPVPPSDAPPGVSGPRDGSEAPGGAEGAAP